MGGRGEKRVGEERSGRGRREAGGGGEKWVGEEERRIYTQKPTTESLLTFDSSSDEQESVLQ